MEGSLDDEIYRDLLYCHELSNFLLKRCEVPWITKNGIRLTGMPGFGKVYSDEQIWHIARFIRSLGTGRSSKYRRFADDASKAQ